MQTCADTPKKNWEDLTGDQKMFRGFYQYSRSTSMHFNFLVLCASFASFALHSLPAKPSQCQKKRHHHRKMPSLDYLTKLVLSSPCRQRASLPRYSPPALPGQMFTLTTVFSSFLVMLLGLGRLASLATISHRLVYGDFFSLRYYEPFWSPSPPPKPLGGKT